ncbi:hypothetical protein [Burkholderia sp. MSMB1835]|uniref:hypothetical protein n=1 Tax=Burkholderia sp. MSMB1835 TaxID=1637876 RepID=UPI0009E7CFB8|nr:hypothetical protein [Burkholderia sp. MSMB1835]
MLKNAWAGNEPLWKVWWGLGIPTRVAVFLINVCVRHMVDLSTPKIYLVPPLCAQLVLIAAWVRTAWICAPNVRHRLWMYLARIWLVLWLLSLVQQTLQRG